MAEELKPIFHTPVMHFDDINGRPLVGGRLYSYKAGTNTPVNLYRNPQGTLLHENPVRLNMRGECVAYGKEGILYKLVLKDRFGATVWEVDNVSASGGGSGGGGGGMWPSILVAQSDTMEGDDDTESQDFTFSQIEKVGDDIYIDDNNEIRLKKGIYHVSLVITFNVNSTEESRPWIEEVTFNYPLGYSGTLLDRSIRWPHGGSSNISVDFDYVVNADDTKLAMWLNSLGDEAYAKMKPISIHKIAEVE